MMQSTDRRGRQRGSAILKVILALILVAIAYGIYRAYSFYQSTVAPVVETVSEVASAVTSVATLNPYKLTSDPQVIEAALLDTFRIAPPEGYVGAFGLSVELFGRKPVELVTLIPKDADPAQIFEGGEGEIRFNPGPHTIFLAAKYNDVEPADMREAILQMAGGEGQAERLEQVFIDAGGKRVAALRGNVQSYGATNTVAYLFLDDGRSFVAMGPAAAFDEAALTRAATALSVAHPANSLLYAHVDPDAIEPPSSDACGIPGLANEFDVVVVQVQRGSKALDVAIDQSGEDVAQEDVVVGTTEQPVVLVLMGEYPIVWNIGQTDGARIAGVLAQGQHRQSVIGLPTSTLLTTYSQADGPNACKHFRLSPDNGAEDLAAKRRLRELFGRGVNQVLTTKSNGQFRVGTVSGEIRYSDERTLASVVLPDDVLPGGDYGLRRLVKDGAIRLATDDEITAWLQGAAKRKGSPVDTVRRNMDWRLGDDQVYVALREFDLPEGLGGANARTFILPPGTPKPGGPQGHCTFLHLDTFECSGTACTL